MDSGYIYGTMRSFVAILIFLQLSLFSSSLSDYAGKKEFSIEITLNDDHKMTDCFISKADTKHVYLIRAYGTVSLPLKKVKSFKVYKVGSPKHDGLLLTNGDVIQGKVVSKTAEVVTVFNKSLDRAIAIPADKVAEQPVWKPVLTDPLVKKHYLYKELISEFNVTISSKKFQVYPYPSYLWS